MIVLRCRHCEHILGLHGHDRTQHSVSTGCCTAAECQALEARRGYRALSVAQQRAILRSAEVAYFRREAQRLRADLQAAIVRGDGSEAIARCAEAAERRADELEGNGR